MEEEIIDVNHTLVYYNHTTNECYFNIHTPKTEAGKRKIPMLDFVKRAFIAEKLYQEKEHICYHSLRHTFTTRLVEPGVNIKVVQDVLGHKDIPYSRDDYYRIAL